MASPLSCDQCEELLAGYLLRALETEEVRVVSIHLATCSTCQASLEAYQVVLDQLGEAVPTQEPPAELPQRLLVAALEDTPEVAPGSTVGVPRARPRTPRWAWVLTAANVLLCLGLGWWAWQAQREARLVRHILHNMQHRLALQQQALTLIAAPEIRAVALRGDGASVPAHGVLWLQPAETQAVLVVQDLPPLQAHRAYQLWLVWGDRQRDNGGVFQVDEHGFGMLRIQAPRPLATYRAVGITEEPAGGSPGPTSPRVIGGTL